MSKVRVLFLMILLAFLPGPISTWITIINILDSSASTEIRWNNGDPIVVLHNSIFASGKYIQGRTFGHVIALSCKARCLHIEEHELAHVKQHNFLGSYYLPAHVTCLTFSYIVSGDTDKYNPLEWGPYHDEPVPFGTSTET